MPTVLTHVCILDDRLALRHGAWMDVLACRQAAWAGIVGLCQHIRSKGGCCNGANRMQGVFLAACELFDCRAAGRRCWPAALHKASL